MNITEQSIVGELVAQDYRTASIFKSFGIDFCCKGNRTIADVCQSKNLDSRLVLESLQEATRQQGNNGIDFNTWPIDLLADYIEKTHHRYVNKRVEDIAPFLYKVVRVHGDRHPELVEIGQLFEASVKDLTMHMKKEELVLFPYIRELVEAQVANKPMDIPPFTTVQNPIAMMHREHEAEGDRFARIAELTNNYQLPADACNTYRVTFALLKEFEQDLHHHIHLENNILFPKAVALEQKLS